MLSVDEWLSTFEKVIKYERKKIILPILMLIILISTVGLGSHLRSENVDEEMVQNSQHAMENLTIISMEHEFFNQSISASQRERSQRMSERTQQETEQIMNRPAVKAGIYLLRFTYKSGMYPLLPSSVPGQEDNSILFSKSNGYFLTDTYPETLAEISYFQYRMKELRANINSSRENWTLEEFRKEVNQIRSIEYPDERITTHLEKASKDRDSEHYTGASSVIVSNDEWRKSITYSNIKEVKFYHFLPAAVATFVLYYLLSGLLLEILRSIKSKI